MARWWKGRFGYRLLLEIAVMASLLTLYRLGRYLGRNQVDVAFQHARDVLQVEDALGIASERGFQALVLDNLTFIRLMNRYYTMVHFPATVAFLAVVYVRPPNLQAHPDDLHRGYRGRPRDADRLPSRPAADAERLRRHGGHLRPHDLREAGV